MNYELIAMAATVTMPPMPPPSTPVKKHLQILRSLHESLTHANQRYQNELVVAKDSAEKFARAFDPTLRPDQPVWYWHLPGDSWWMPRLGMYSATPLVLRLRGQN